jgi:hypothetical protein
VSLTVGLESAAHALDRVGLQRTPRRGAWYACVLLVGALLVTGAAVVLDGRWPPLGPVLLLAVPLALCTRRFVVIPDEPGATDAAVIFAAMVAFHDRAPWLGPLVLALLAGPLAAEHWTAQAFVRMAYHSGRTTLVTAAALVTYGIGTGVLGASAPALLGAAAVAVVPYMLAESVLGAGLDAMLGERLAAAMRHHLPAGAIAIPFALLGAGAGIAAVDLGWWSAGALLLPALLLPELLLLLVRVRRLVRPAPARVVSGLLVLGVVLVASMFVLPGTEAWGRTVGLLAVACFVGAECRLSVWPVPPVGGLVVVPTAMLVIPGPATVVVVLAVPVGAALLMLATSPRASVLWSLPFLAGAACAAGAWATVGRVGALGFCLGVPLGIGIAGAWGPTPWTSRVLVPRVSPWFDAHRRRALVVAAAGAVGAAWSAVAAAGATRTGLALTSAALSETVVAMGALAVRFWRFAPRRRTVDALVLATTALLTASAYLALALHGAIGSVPLAMALVAAAAFVAWPLAPDRAPATRHVSEELDVAHRE